MPPVIQAGENRKGEVTQLASEKILADKKEYVAQLRERITNSQSGVIFNYGGINVEEDTKLRKELRERGVSYEVVKNTMMRIALKDTPFEEMSRRLTGTTALAVSGEDDPIAAARILYKFSEDSRGRFEIKTGYMDGEVLDKEGIRTLATLPSREGLLSMLLSALTGNLSGLARAIDAVREKSESAAEAAETIIN